ncbi:hypothetical protein NQ176_g4004 [Zarea fungicola]|uniref:Uncharacterized protein n=1 Tax=Zarea fungicola TaxID=93591 RepID=A0ACC1NGC3_9HYPO|nr:hypothetical protein NQ176_g4004 [Lecanicillium fungicola]
MRSTSVLPVIALVANAAAKTVNVDVGQGFFSPSVIKADKGDTIEFRWIAVGHSVATGLKDKVCQPAPDAFFSGEVSTLNTTFSVMVDSTDPTYIYCTVPGHCQVGMVGVINGDEDGLSAYKAAAAKSSGSTSPDNVGGGSLGMASSSSTTGAAPSTSSSATATGSKTSAGSTASSSSSSAPTSNAAVSLKGSACTFFVTAGVAAMML